MRNKNARLHLKGRIFMTNVTDVLTLSKPGESSRMPSDKNGGANVAGTGAHSVQIWWKGDPGVEYFTIKFPNEEIMRKWAEGLQTQRKENGPRVSAGPDGIAHEFTWTRDQAGNLENPYLQQQDDDDDDEYGPATAPAQFPVPSQPVLMPRTSSSSSLRQRSATNESTQSLAGMVRAAPPRFPMPLSGAPLTLQTQPSSAVSPGSRVADSYFSPVDNSPASSRTSNASGLFSNFPPSKVGTPQPGWDENNRYTAPAMPRAPSRDENSPNPMAMNGRNPRGPSLPAMATQHSAAQQQRSRSYSTPDINVPGGVRQRQASQGGGVPAVPGIPSHLHDNSIPRSQTSSPRNDLPVRTSTQSPGAQQRMHQHSGSLGGQMGQFPAQPLYPRGSQPPPPPGAANPMRVDAAAANARAVSGGPATASLTSPPVASPETPFPTQLKVKVNLDSGNYVTLVVAFNISYQSLIDRIDAKLSRFTSNSIGKGVLKLQYRDEDGDYIVIQSDDDIQIAFMEWREGMRSMYSGGVGEIDLYCIGDA